MFDGDRYPLLYTTYFQRDHCQVNKTFLSTVTGLINVPARLQALNRKFRTRARAHTVVISSTVLKYKQSLVVVVVAVVVFVLHKDYMYNCDVQSLLNINFICQIILFILLSSV